MLKPIHEMTEAEFEGLPQKTRFKYKPCFAGPAHTNFYICWLHHRLQEGRKICKRVWDSLRPCYQSHLRHVADAWMPDKKPNADS